MAPGGTFDCDCFTCTGGGRAGPERVSRSTLYNHRKHGKRRRLDPHSVGSAPDDDGGGSPTSAGVGAGDGAGAGVVKGACAGAGAGAGAGAEATTGAGASPSDMAGAVTGAGLRWSTSGPAGNDRRCDADETPESSEASETSDPDDVPTPGIETEIVPESEVGHAP